MGKNFRIRTKVGVDTRVETKLEQDFDFLEILSLKLSQQQVYNRPTSNYGVLCGRVYANNGFGVPNAKVSVFIPLTDEDSNNPVISRIYPYRNLNTQNEDGYRYNLLPYVPSYTGHVPTGTFPDREDVLKDKSLSYVYEKYYKFTAKTNDAGDFMIFGAPVGNHTIVMDVDVSDIGQFSLTPQDLLRIGRATEAQLDGAKFKESTDLDSLPQIIGIKKTIDINPFWGDPDLATIAVTRVDFNLLEEANIEFKPTCVFMGSLISGIDTKAISKTCKVKVRAGDLCELITGPGQILAIRQTVNFDSLGRPILEQYKVENDGQVIDENGTWMIDLPMNMDYVYTDEEGKQQISYDPSIGIPTKGRYRFKIKWNQSDKSTEQLKRGYFLVPNIKEYGWDKDILGNNPAKLTPPPTVPTTITANTITTVSANGGEVTSYEIDQEMLNYANSAFGKFTRSYSFSLSWFDYVNPQSAINCEDTFYEFQYNKVYTVSQLIDKYRSGKLPARFLGFKNCLDDKCAGNTEKFPVNDGHYNITFLYVLLTALITLAKPIVMIIFLIFAVLARIYRIIVDFICDKIIPLLRDLGRTRTIAGFDFIICPTCNDTANDLEEKWCNKPNPFTDKRLPLLLQDDGDCSFCDCRDSGEELLSGSVYGATNSSCLADIAATSKWLYDSNISTDILSAPQINLLAGYTAPSFNFASKLPTNSCFPTDYSFGALRFDYGSILKYEETEGAAVFSPSLTIAERLNLFNTKAKYFDSGGLESGFPTKPSGVSNVLGINSGTPSPVIGGWNRIKLTISSTPAQQNFNDWNIPQKADVPDSGTYSTTQFHLDNVMILLVDENCKLGTTRPGEIVTFTNPSLSKDKNLTGFTTTLDTGEVVSATNPYGGQQITGSVISASAQTSAIIPGPGYVDVWYAKPEGGGREATSPKFKVTGETFAANSPTIIRLANFINSSQGISAGFGGNFDINSIRGEALYNGNGANCDSFPYNGNVATYQLNYPDNYISPYYKYPADLEYFQIIENYSVSNFISKCAPDDTGNVMSLKRRYLLNQMQIIRWRRFKYYITGDSGQNSTNLGKPANENNTNYYIQPIVYTNQLKPNDLFKDFNKLRIVILQRGVDPYSPQFLTKVDLSRLLGYTDFAPNFSASANPQRVIEVYLRLNQPIQGNSKSNSHYFFSNKRGSINSTKYNWQFEGYLNGYNDEYWMDRYSRIFYKSKFFKPSVNQFQEFSSDVLQKYSALGDSCIIYPGIAQRYYNNYVSKYLRATYCQNGSNTNRIYYGPSTQPNLPANISSVGSYLANKTSNGEWGIYNANNNQRYRPSASAPWRLLLFNCTNPPGYNANPTESVTLDTNNDQNQYYFTPYPLNGGTNGTVSVLNNNSSIAQDGITTNTNIETILKDRINYTDNPLKLGSNAKGTNLYTQRWKKALNRDVGTFIPSYIGVNQTVNWAANLWNNTWTTTGSPDGQGINDYYEYPGYMGYFTNENLDGGSYMYAEVNQPQGTNGTATYEYLTQIYYVPRYSSAVTVTFQLLPNAASIDGAIQQDRITQINTFGQNQYENSFPNQGTNDFYGLMRCDRLPSSDNTETEGKNSFVLYQNNQFAVYILDRFSTGGTATNFSQSPQNVSGLILEDDNINTQGTSEFPLQAVLESTSNCAKSKNLGCYSITVSGTVSISQGQCSLIPKDSEDDSEKVKFFDNGCYIFVRTDEDFMYSFSTDARIVSELFLRIKYNLAICLNVISHNFNNDWINGTLLAFPFKQVTIFGGNNQISQRNFCKETMMFNYQSNNFYYRSSPYATADTQYILQSDGSISGPNTQGQFVGQFRNSRNTAIGSGSGVLGNNRQLLFPTTIMDMGPVNPNIQEYVYSDEYDGYMLNNLNSTTFQNNSDILNFFTLTRLLKQSGLDRFVNQNNQFVPDVVTDSLFDSRGSEKAVDGDYAQSIAINSQLGIINFTPENYTYDTVRVFLRETGSGSDLVVNPIFGIFFSGSTSERDLVSPRRIIYIENSSVNLSADYFLNILTKSQEVPFYHWEIKDVVYKPGSDSQPTVGGTNIFGSESNNWLTGPVNDPPTWSDNFNQNDVNTKFFKLKYQEVDRLNSNSNTFQNYNMLQFNLKGWTWDTWGGSLNYQNVSGTKGKKKSKILNGAPYYFYFGLIKGATAWDRFVRRWINTTEEL